MATTFKFGKASNSPLPLFLKLDSPNLKFCDPQADLSFKSSDGIIFKIYSKYLEATSGALPVPKAISSGTDDVVCLQEKSEVLELLFQFIHPRAECDNYRQPSVMTMPPKILFPFAEAAEKYQVFGAMNTCITRFHQIIKEHPIEILNHSYRHGYFDLADQAAIHTISQPLNMVVKGLTQPDILQRWLLYYVHWRDIAATAMDLLNGTTSVSADCTPTWTQTKKDFARAVLTNTWGDDYVITHTSHEGFASSICPNIQLIATIQKQIDTQKALIPKFTAITIPG